METKRFLIGCLILFGFIGALIVINNSYKEKEVTIKTSFDSSVQFKSVNEAVWAGIQSGKKKDHEKAIRQFAQARILLESRGLLLVEDDMARFSSLINEFKTGKKSIYKNLFSHLPEVIKVKIKALKHSRDINKELVKDVLSGVNKILLRENMSKELGLDLDEIETNELIQKLKWLDQDASKKAFKDEESKKIYKNRLVFSYFYKPYFKPPFSKIDLLLNQAISQFHKGDFKIAEESLMSILELRKNNPKVYMLLSRIVEGRNKVTEAIEILEQGLVELPESEMILSELGTLYFRDGEPEKAQELFEKALVVNPKYKYALFGQQASSRKSGQKLKPSHIYKKEIKASPKDMYAHSNYVTALLRENKFLDCEDALKDALKLFPNDSYLLKIRGRLKGIQKDYHGAVQALIKARKGSHEADLDIYLLLGITYFNQMENYQAIKELEEGIKKFPDSSDLHLNLAKVYEMTSGRQNDAIKYYESYLEKFPKAKNKIKIGRKIRKLKGGNK